MFTGIVTAVGLVAAVTDLRCRFSCPPNWLGRTVVGDSIAVNGACLTVTHLGEEYFDCDISQETRRCCAPLAPRDRVNLEQALALGDKLGGHLVTGHIDGVARVVRAGIDAGGGCTMRLMPPPALGRFLAAKGSVTLAGVSLTVNRLNSDDSFEVYILPHTLAQTNLADCAAGAALNMEVDIIARHIARLLEKGAPAHNAPSS